MFRCEFHTLSRLCGRKRPTEWKLPDLDKLPGGFRGEVYNKRDWTNYLEKKTDILEEEKDKDGFTHNVRPPPPNWRKMKGLPQYMKKKYALKEKALKIDLSKTKRLSRSAMEGIRMLHDKYPSELSTDRLAEFFKISPIAISKILKSRWKPSQKELVKKNKKWEKRGEKLTEAKMLDTRLEEFFKAKEDQLHVEIPYFVKQELSDYIHLHAKDDLEESFAKLNQARAEKQKFKDDKMKENVSKA